MKMDLAEELIVVPKSEIHTSFSFIKSIFCELFVLRLTPFAVSLANCLYVGPGQSQGWGAQTWYFPQVAGTQLLEPLAGSYRQESEPGVKPTHTDIEHGHV